MPKSAPRPRLSPRGLFRTATHSDMFLLLVGGVCALLNGGSLSAFTILLGSVFDRLNSPDPKSAQPLAIYFFYIAMVVAFTALAQVSFFTIAADRATARIKVAYLRALLRQEIGFFDANGAGVLVAQLDENSVMFREAIGEKLASLFQFAATFVSGLVVAYVFFWRLGLVVLAFLPLLACAIGFLGKSLVFLTSGKSGLYAQAGAVADEALRWIRMITAFGLQKDRLDAYDVQLAKAEKTAVRIGWILGIGFGSIFFIIFSVYAVGFEMAAVFLSSARVSAASARPMLVPAIVPFCIVGGQVPSNCSTQAGIIFFKSAVDVCTCPYCQCGCFAPLLPVLPNVYTLTSACVTGGDVILCFFSLLIASFALGQAAPSVTALINGLGAARALYEIIDRKPEIDMEDDRGIKPNTVRGDIEFKNVAFTYPTRLDAPIFKDLNFTIHANKRVALVGESGCGKSTVIALLQRFYNPLEGSIKLDGVNIKDYNLKTLRSYMGLVTQDPVLFEQTVLENIRLGRPDATDDEVIRAAKTANIHNEILRFPNQYQTFITQNLVSGGQAQRLQIARAILRNPQILLLDEATSALDNKSEAIVNAALDELIADQSRNRTTILIAHRLSSIIESDMIYVFHKGVVVEQGTHDDLIIVPSGRYSAMVNVSVQGRMKNSISAPMNIDERDILSDLPRGGGKEGEEVFSGTIKSGTVVPEEFKPTAGAAAELQESYPISSLWQFTRQDWILYIPGLLAAVLNGLTFPFYAFLLSRFLATFYMINHQDMLDQAMVLALSFFGLACAVGIVNFVQTYLFTLIGARMTTRVRHGLFKRMMSLEIGFFDLRENSIGALSSKLGSDSGKLRSALADRLQFIAQTSSTVVAGLLISFLGSWVLSLIVCAFLPGIILAGAGQFMMTTGFHATDQKSLEKAAHTLTETVHGIRTVTAFAMGPDIMRTYLEQNGHYSYKQAFVAGGVFGVSQSVAFIMLGVALYVGADLIANGLISFQGLNQALFGILLTALSLGQTAMISSSVAQGSVAVDSIMRIMNRASKIDPFDESGIKPSSVLGDVAFDNVTFEYPTRPGVIVLRNFKLKIERGTTVAFVGSSGAGKSTVVGMLERFYDPLTGKVTIDGRDVREYNVQFLRSLQGLVSQQPVLMHGTILENVRAGIDGATENDVIAACKLANAHDFISALPDGYRTQVIGNSSLSGGQKQRVVIAKVLVRNPKILILDEATSALDEESQRVVQQALDGLLSKNLRTTLIVAHRLSTIRNADTIVMLHPEEGIIEQGTFNELVQRNGAFASLLKAQNNAEVRAVSVV